MKRFAGIKLMFIIVCVCLALPAALSAEDAPAKPAALPKVAVKTLTAKGVSADTASALTEILCTRLMSHKKYQILCASDVTAILVATQQTALLGNCDDESCYDALGKALDTPYLIVGAIGKVGKLYTVNLSLISTADKLAKKRVSHEVSGDESRLVEGVKEAADKLMK